MGTDGMSGGECAKFIWLCLSGGLRILLNSTLYGDPGIMHYSRHTVLKHCDVLEMYEI